MQELTELLGEELAKYVLGNNIFFIPGYTYKPETNDGNPNGYTITIQNAKFKTRVNYNYRSRFLSKNLIGKLEISLDGLNGKQKELAEVVGGLLKECGKNNHERLNPLYLVNPKAKLPKKRYKTIIKEF